MLKKLFLALVLNCIAFGASASHLMGGEITWKCVGTQFQFYMKLYRDCNGATGPTAVTLSVYNHPTLTSISLNLLSQTDISPQCDGAGPTITCAGGGQGATEEFIYQSAPLTISGTPPAQGWAFVYTDCCRNAAITNLNMGLGSSGFTLRAMMYAYHAQNTNPCFDNSPEFLESPKTIICTGYPFTYNHNAVDAELDSLAYDWAEPLDWMPTGGPFNPGTNPIFYPFNAGYTYQSPLPGTAQNASNVPATIDPNTGEISYTSFTSGNFVTCVKVEAWKCGIKVAEIFREIQVVLLPCGSNSPPIVTPPFQNPVTSLFTDYRDTVYVGQLVTFNLTATDFQFLTNGNPQTVTINATGNEFGAGFTNTTTGCINPPCATLNPPPPVSAPFGAATTFSWQTDCNHVYYQNQCFTQSNTYNFIIRTSDDFCPAPALNIATISITVLGLPVVDSPNLHCLAVQPNGDVTLTWDLQPDTGGTYNSYHIFSSTSAAGPFTEIDSIFNYNQLTYTHVGANANAGPVYYYVQTRSGCGGMVNTPVRDTLSTIYLTVTNPNNGTAGLSWTPLSTPLPGSSMGWYRIWREYPTGNWTLLDSTQALTYVDTIAVCNDWINYRIEMGDTLGCVSVSNIDGDQFQDITVPAAVTMDTASVVTGGLAQLGWSQSTSQDVVGYIVYQYINGVWTAIDTVYGISNTGYLNALSTAGTQSEQYAVAPMDSCGNVSPFSPTHQTLYLNTYLDVCNGATNLTWNSYININSNLGGYNVFCSVNGGPYTLIGTTTPGDTTFTHTGLIQFSTYCYYIQAYNAPNDMTASSQIACVFANVPQQPVFEYMKVATVSASNQVKLEAFVDVAADILRYDIYRADALAGPYSVIGSVAPGASPIVTYYDNTALTNEQSYYYKMQAIDSCGNPSLSSNIARTIFLSVRSEENVTNQLTWNDYETWLGTVNHYRIYRSVDGIYNPVPIASVPYTAAGINYFTDDVGNFLTTNVGRFGYYVEAFEGAGNPYSFTDTSRSNLVDVQQNEHVYVPNAFTPAGNNPIFIPVTGFVDLQDYHFAVFNRWGEMIFETDDRHTGWNGKYQDKNCEQAVYVWTLTFKTAEGQYIDRKGTVLLMR